MLGFIIPDIQSLSFEDLCDFERFLYEELELSEIDKFDTEELNSVLAEVHMAIQEYLTSNNLPLDFRYVSSLDESLKRLSDALAFLN